MTILIKEILPPSPLPFPPLPPSTSFSGDSVAGFHLRSTSRTARSSMAVTKRKNLMKILA